MLESESLASTELVVRRFDPDRDDHIATDEGTGQPRLRRGAFILRKGEDGLSVHRRLILEHNGLSLDQVVRPPYVGLAQAQVEDVGSCEPPWSVVADPWPRGEDGPPEDVAHSLIVPSVRPTGAHFRKLVACFSILNFEAGGA